MQKIGTMAAVLLLVVASLSHAQTQDASRGVRSTPELQTKTVQYEHNGTELQGHLVWDGNLSGKRPGVLVVHEWWGLNDYARSRAEQLAKLGYVAFAVDMYGKGKVTEHPRQAREWATQVRSNVQNWRERGLAGLEILRSHPLVDKNRLAAIGYCFGGSTVLQLAFSGADLRAIVSFHGALPIPDEEQVKQIQASLLICHGAADPFIPEGTTQQFRAALSKGNVDWVMNYYANAQHSFTSPGANEKNIEGIRYNRKADQRSWRDMQAFFNEVLDPVDVKTDSE